MNSILGTESITVEQCTRYLLRINPNAPNIIPHYKKYGELLGIRWGYAVAQMIKETGYLKFGGDVVLEQHNYAGLGTIGGGAKGVCFTSDEEGVLAHLEHLYAYACKEPLPSDLKKVDPRFSLVTRGIAPNWEDLNGRWAVPGVGYGEEIAKIYEQMAKEGDIVSDLIYDLVFDPGHGGSDPGAVGPTTKEKDNVLMLAKKTAAYLVSTGRFRVKFTRDTDKDFCNEAPYNEDLDLKNRVSVANALSGKVFVAFHNNSALVKAYGNEVYAAAPGADGEKLAKAIRSRMAAQLDMVDRGVKFYPWYVCKWTDMPAVLVEYGFINSEEAVILAKMDQAALTIAQGIGDHFGISVDGQRKEAYDVKEAVLAYGIEDYLVPARRESIKLGNCAVFTRFDDKKPPTDVFKAEHLTIVGGGSVGHPNETILSGKTWGDTAAAVSATGA